MFKVFDDRSTEPIHLSDFLGRVWTMMVLLDMMNHLLERSEAIYLMMTGMYKNLTVRRYHQCFEARACEKVDHEYYLLESMVVVIVLDAVGQPKSIVEVHEPYDRFL